MTISATSVRFDTDSTWVELTDGRTLAFRSHGFRDCFAQRDQVELSRVGLHWDEIDEDIPIAGLLAGRGDVTRSTECKTDILTETTLRPHQ